jgi:hypothetical protein
MADHKAFFQPLRRHPFHPSMVDDKIRQARWRRPASPLCANIIGSSLRQPGDTTLVMGIDGQTLRAALEEVHHLTKVPLNGLRIVSMSARLCHAHEAGWSIAT